MAGPLPAALASFLLLFDVCSQNRTHSVIFTFFKLLLPVTIGLFRGCGPLCLSFWMFLRCKTTLRFSLCGRADNSPNNNNRHINAKKKQRTLTTNVCSWNGVERFGTSRNETQNQNKAANKVTRNVFLWYFQGDQKFKLKTNPVGFHEVSFKSTGAHGSGVSLRGRAAVRPWAAKLIYCVRKRHWPILTLATLLIKMYQT